MTKPTDHVESPLEALQRLDTTVTAQGKQIETLTAGRQETGTFLSELLYTLDELVIALSFESASERYEKGMSALRQFRSGLPLS